MAQAGLNPCCRIAMQDSLVNRVIDESKNRRRKGLSRAFVLCIEGSAQLPDLVAQARAVSTILLSARGSLFDSLQS
jgi:hypothetical protein